MEEELRQGHVSDVARVYEGRVQGRMVALANPERESKRKKERREAKAKRRMYGARARAGVMGLREARETGVWKVREGGLR